MESPVQFLDHVSRALDLPVWIKREDLYVRHGLGGSKVRKLERIIQNARNSFAADLVTCGTTGSHHVHAASLLGNCEGLSVHAVVLPQPQLPYADAIHEQTRSINRNLTYVRYLAQVAPTMLRIHRRLAQEGRRPYFVFPGGSNPAGVTAYTDAALEMRNAPALREIDFQICVYGTGGITAGLINAIRQDTALPPVVAVQVYPGFWNSKVYIRSLAMLARLKTRSVDPVRDANGTHKGITAPRSAIDLRIVKDYLGRGYGTANPACDEAVEIFRKDSIFLDPIYMARAGQALLEAARLGKKPRGLLLWYTSPSMRA